MAGAHTLGIMCAVWIMKVSCYLLYVFSDGSLGEYSKLVVIYCIRLDYAGLIKVTEQYFLLNITFLVGS